MTLSRNIICPEVLHACCVPLINSSNSHQKKKEYVNSPDIEKTQKSNGSKLNFRFLWPSRELMRFRQATRADFISLLRRISWTSPDLNDA